MCSKLGLTLCPIHYFIILCGMDNGLGHRQIESFSYEMFPLNFRLAIGVQLEVHGRVATQCPDGDGLSER